MAQVQFPFSDLEELVSVGKEDAIEKLSMLGFPAEETEEGGLNVEVTPNRPDALSVEGIARVLRTYLTGQPIAYQIGRSEIGIRVDASVENVRPFIGAAHVSGVRLTDSALRSSMQLQEKLHETLGRKRRKSAIGLYDADMLKPPFRYFACGREEVRFVPLERTESMTPLEIMRRHPKGIDYAHLVGDLCPMIEDARGQVLSFPPIINGESSKVTPDTTNLFIEATGMSQEAVLHAVNIVASSLAERGGKIEAVAINGEPYEILKETRWQLPVQESERLLGIKLTEEQVAGLLRKMGYRMEGSHAYAPGFRADIINEVDLIEDVAIAYGFNNFEPSLPSAATVGRENAEHPCHEILVGLGFDEVVSWHLSNRQLEAKARLPEGGGAAEIENPLTGDYTMFRRAVLPNLLSVLAESRNEKLPIKIYEAGPVAAPQLSQRLAACSMHPRASFSEIKGAVLSLFSSQGREVEIRAAEHGPYVNGRCAEIVLDGAPIGFMGEISPEVLAAFNLEQPVCAVEIQI